MKQYRNKETGEIVTKEQISLRKAGAALDAMGVWNLGNPSLCGQIEYETKKAEAQMSKIEEQYEEITNDK